MILNDRKIYLLAPNHLRKHSIARPAVSNTEVMFNNSRNSVTHHSQKR